MILALFWPALVSSCDLVPVGPPSCLDLTSTSHISTDTQFGQYIEGSGTNRKGEMFAVNYGNDSTLFALGKFLKKEIRQRFSSNKIENKFEIQVNSIRNNASSTPTLYQTRTLTG